MLTWQRVHHNVNFNTKWELLSHAGIGFKLQAKAAFVTAGLGSDIRLGGQNWTAALLILLSAHRCDVSVCGTRELEWQLPGGTLNRHYMHCFITSLSLHCLAIVYYQVVLSPMKVT